MKSINSSVREPAEQVFLGRGGQEQEGKGGSRGINPEFSPESRLSPGESEETREPFSGPRQLPKSSGSVAGGDLTWVALTTIPPVILTSVVGKAVNPKGVHILVPTTWENTARHDKIRSVEELEGKGLR